MTRPDESTDSAKAEKVESIRNRRWIEGFVGAAYLEKLNTEQRLAVEYGTGLLPSTIGGPLRVIAGARSGKTNTLAHRRPPMPSCCLRKEPNPGARSQPAGVAAEAVSRATMTHDYKRKGKTTLFSRGTEDGSIRGWPTAYDTRHTESFEYFFGTIVLAERLLLVDISRISDFRQAV